MNKKSLFLCFLATVLAIIFTVLVKVVDVRPVGPESSLVGFATLNSAFHELTSFNQSLFSVTEHLGLLLIPIVAFYVTLGVVQLVKRKSLKKLDRTLLLLAGFYAVVAVIYLLFEKIAINFRPVLFDGALEPSYPSSHTLFAICLCGSAILVNRVLFSDKSYIRAVNLALGAIAILIVIGRLLSGVHWLTDIVGGLLISATLLSWFNFYLSSAKSRRK